MHTIHSSPLFIDRRPQRGFTLVELLIVITIVITLAAISFAVFTKMRAKADNSVSLEYMHQVGVAIASYTSDQDHLPGFMDPEVSPAYSLDNSYTQAGVLQPYLGTPEPTATTQYAPVFRPPGLKPNNMGGKKNWYEVTCYAMYDADHFVATKAYLSKTSKTGEDWGSPFGKSTSGTPTPGWKLAQLDAQLAQFSEANGGKIATLSMVPAMLEVNSKHGSWKGTLPVNPIYGTHVNVLYFDWRVESVPVDFFYK